MTLSNPDKSLKMDTFGSDIWAIQLSDFDKMYFS